MTERPIPLRRHDVQALRDGRKFQFRRVAKLRPSGCVKVPGEHTYYHPEDPEAVKACPYGQPGDFLWVRERWATIRDFEEVNYPGGGMDVVPVTRAIFEADDPCRSVKWNQSVHMPRWASRFTLQIREVRLERLQAITEEGALLEGIDSVERGGQPKWFLGGTHKVKGTPKVFYEARTAFEDLWIDAYGRDHCHGRSAWDSNPRVWVVSFRQHDGRSKYFTR